MEDTKGTLEQRSRKSTDNDIVKHEKDQKTIVYKSKTEN